VKRKTTYFSIIIGLVTLVVLLYINYIDRQNCICSHLNDEMKQFEIDRRLLDVCDTSPASTGTFFHVITHCRHNEPLQLLVFPDEGFYYGRKSKTTVRDGG